MKRGLPWIAGAAVTLVFLVIFHESAFGGRLPLDSVETNDVSFTASAYEQWATQVRNGRVPLWFPEFDGGTPLAAAWMYGLLYPGLALFLFLPTGVAWVWTAALHAGLGAAGMASFSLRRGATLAGAATAAVLFAVSEHFVGRTVCGHLNLVLPLAWMPWALAAADACVRGERGGVPRLAMSAGLGLLSGHVQLWIYLGPLVAAFALSEAWLAEDRRGALRRVVTGAALALTIAAAQIAITAEFLSASVPAFENAKIVRGVSVPPTVLLSKLVGAFPGPAPDAAGGDLDFRHEFRGIAGLWAFGLAGWAVATGARRRWLWTGFAVAGLVAAIGTRIPLTAWIQEIPPFSLARAPGRFLVLPLVCVPILAAHAPFERLREPLRWGVCAAAGVLACFAGIPAVRSVSDELHRVAWADRIPAEFRGHRVHSRELYQLTNLERSGLDAFRTLCYVRTKGWSEVMSEPSKEIAWWVDLAAELEPVVRPGAPVVPSMDDIERTEIIPYPAMGRGRWFGTATFGVPGDDVLRRMRRGDRILFLDGPAAPESLSRGEFVARPVASDADSLTFETNAPGPGWLLVSMKLYPGWTATVDGEPAELRRGNLAFPAVRVPAGKHTVRLEYRPLVFRITFTLSIAVLALAVRLSRTVRRGPAGPDGDRECVTTK